jgi:steroid 5-alpha reductase family enzyme
MMLSPSLSYFVEAMRAATSNVSLLSPTQENPLLNTAAVTLIATVSVYVLGMFTGNHSFVDKSWSILPVYYCWQFGLAELSCLGGRSSAYPRATVAACIVTVWGIRLTYNFYRKGGYSWSGEDYRWEVLRARMSPLLYHVFHVVFIAILQNILLTAITLPLAVSWHTTCVVKTPQGFNEYDAVAIIACIFCLIVEAVADQEQFDFHARKHANRLHASEKKLGFLTDGLFAYSRHPNFFAEQSFWVCFCLFASASTGELMGWWVVGSMALIALFHGSTAFTEDITGSKYPQYAAYRKKVNRLVPRLEL